MAYNLNPQERQLVQNLVNHEDMQSVSYILQSILLGSDIHPRDIESLDDHCMDLANNSESEGFQVPAFIDALRNICDKLFSSAGVPAQTQFAPLTANIPAAQPGVLTPYQPTQPPVKPPKPPKPKKPVSEATPKVKPTEKYKKTELNAENIPPYLIEIHELVEKIVDARCAEEIKKRIEAEEKLEKVQKLIGALS